jgi:hypothetical protein
MNEHDPTQPERFEDGITPVTRAERHALEALEELEPKGRRFSKRLLAVQALGGVFGFAVFGLAIHYATSGENAEALERLKDAPAHLVAALMLFSVGTITTWGAMFTVSISPLHRIPLGRTIAVNAIATFVAAVPFKLSLALRGLIHHKRDGIPIRDCLSWFAALSGLTILTMLGLAGVALLTESANALFYALAVVWIVAAHVVSIAVSRLIETRARTGKADDRMNTARWVRRLTIGVTRVLDHPGPVALTGVLRVLEVSITAVRFTVAAQLIGVELPIPDALILALTFSVISIVAPTGNLGLREGGTSLVAVAGGLTAETAALIALIVSVAELATALVLAIPAALWVQPWKLFRSDRDGQADASAAGD